MSNHVEQLRAMGYEVRPALKNAATFRWWKTTDGDGVSVHPLDCSTETFATEAAAWHAAASLSPCAVVFARLSFGASRLSHAASP